MSLSGPPGFTFEQALAAIKVSDYAQIAAAALVTYDAFLTLDDEIRLIWCRKWGFDTVLYFLNRYGVPVHAGLNIVTIMDADLSLPACYNWNVSSNWTLPIVLLLIESILLLRVSAMYSIRGVTISLVVLYISAAATMLAIIGVVMQGVAAGPSPAPAVTGCVLRGSTKFYWAMWIPSLVLETTMLVLTIARTARHLRERAETLIIHVILRDGVIYFSVIFVSMLSNLLVYLFAPSLYISLVSQLMLSLSSMVAVRLFLSLRMAAYQYANGPFESDFGTSANVTKPPPPHVPTDSWSTGAFAVPTSYGLPDDSLFASISAI